MVSSSHHEPEPTITSYQPAYSSLELHTPTTLLASPHLPALFNLINHTFDYSHNKDGRFLLPPAEKARLQTHQQLGEEVGPDGFVLIMLQAPSPSPTSSSTSNSVEGFYSQTGHRIIGSASGKPYVPSEPSPVPDSDTITSNLFKRPPPPTSPTEAKNDGTPQWEILAMVVDPTLQGRGLATQLMNLTIDEIKRRCGSGLRDPASTPSFGKVMLLLSTMKELNESYYTKRGWTTTEARTFPPGTKRSRDGFSVAEMFKCVEL